MKYTLLQLTQKVLSSIDGDQVNSIDDTTEARQVVDIIERQYDIIVSRANLPEDQRLFSFESTSSSTPTLLKIPNDIDEVLWFRYNTTGEEDNGRLKYTPVQYLPQETFFDLINSLSSDNSNVGSFNFTTDQGSTTTIQYENDKGPSYWTSFDDGYVVCNSYDSSVDANLQKSKCSAFGRYIKLFSKENTFVPSLDDNLFTLLLNESISCAWAEMKQSQNAKVEQQARRGWVSSQKHKYSLPNNKNPLNSTPNYGR